MSRIMYYVYKTHIVSRYKYVMFRKIRCWSYIMEISRVKDHITCEKLHLENEFKHYTKSNKTVVIIPFG